VASNKEDDIESEGQKLKGKNKIRDGSRSDYDRLKSDQVGKALADEEERKTRRPQPESQNSNIVLNMNSQDDNSGKGSVSNDHHNCTDDQFRATSEDHLNQMRQKALQQMMELRGRWGEQ